MVANAVVISNGIPETTVGHFQVDVTSGGETIPSNSRPTNTRITAARFAANDVVIDNTLVFNYFSYVDTGAPGGGFQLSSSQANPSPPVLLNANTVMSNGSFLGDNENTIVWTAVSTIAPNGDVMNTRFTFTAQTGSLGPLRLLQYLDEDVNVGVDNDVFFPMGSAASGDLELFTFDNTEVYGISHSGVLLPGADLVSASFAGWAADQFNNMRPRIQGLGQDVSPTGVITNLQPLQHPQLSSVFGPEDIVSVLAWDVDPNAATAVITTSLGGVPISAQTVEARPVGNQLRCRGKNCTFQATCLLPPSPGAVCNNRIVVTVSRNALRTSEGTSVRQRRVRFAAGAANVPAGQTAPVRLRLRSAGRQFFRAGGRRIRGVMEIRNVAGTITNRIPVVLRRR